RARIRPLLPPAGARLRLVLPISGADCPAGGRPGGPRDLSPPGTGRASARLKLTTGSADEEMRGLTPSRGRSAVKERGAVMRPRAPIFAVLGDPVDHALSPGMQTPAFAATGLPHPYLRFRVPVRNLRAALADARRLAMGGLNLTLPLKEAVL